MVSTMRFQSLVSEHESTMSAVAEVVQQAREADLGEADVAFVFFTPHHSGEADAMAEQLWLELDPQCVVGCSAESVIGADREIEQRPGLAVLAARMPGVRIHPFHIPTDEWNQILEDPAMLTERIGYGEETRAVIGFGDPWTTPLNPLLQAFDQHLPGAPLTGGMASAARAAGGNVMIRNDQTFSEGFVGASLSGPIRVQTVVSQGCRPIGQRFVITRAHDNVIETLGGKPALGALHDVVNALPVSDRQLLRNGLFVGRAISEYRETFGPGDFLVRNIMGVDDKAGTIAMGDYVRVGQTVQFHVRDAETADEDLRLMLENVRATESDSPAGALLFNCNGRGTRLFVDSPCHDVNVARQLLPGTPIAGFFAGGEIGPVGGKNFVHGHTASFALFRPAE
jgi:small ligand-binding sensory domain FIST